MDLKPEDTISIYSMQVNMNGADYTFLTMTVNNGQVMLEFAQALLAHGLRRNIAKQTGVDKWVIEL